MVGPAHLEPQALPVDLGAAVGRSGGIVIEQRAAQAEDDPLFVAQRLEMVGADQQLEIGGGERKARVLQGSVGRLNMAVLGAEVVVLDPAHGRPARQRLELARRAPAIAGS